MRCTGPAPKWEQPPKNNTPPLNPMFGCSVVQSPTSETIKNCERIGRNDKAQAVNSVASHRGAKQPRVSSYLHKGRGLNLTRMRLA